MAFNDGGVRVVGPDEGPALAAQTSILAWGGRWGIVKG